MKNTDLREEFSKETENKFYNYNGLTEYIKWLEAKYFLIYNNCKD